MTKPLTHKCMTPNTQYMTSNTQIHDETPNTQIHDETPNTQIHDP